MRTVLVAIVLSECCFPRNGAAQDMHAIYSAFDKGQFENAYRLSSEALWKAELSEPVDHVQMIMDQSRKQAWYVKRGITLPDRRHWNEIRGTLPRTDAIKYLCRRLPLATGSVNIPGAVVPHSIRVAFAGKSASDSTEQQAGTIDPFAELLSMKLEAAELQYIYPFFETDWIFRPNEDQGEQCSTCTPAGRYCLCVVVNSICGRPDLIRVTDLSGEEWRDKAAIAAYVERSLRESVDKDVKNRVENRRVQHRVLHGREAE